MDIKPPISKHTCQEAIAHWGKERQLDMVVEELAELSKALMKYRRYGHTEEWRLKCIEEGADVDIMVEQLIMMLSTESEFSKIRCYKIKRLDNLLKSDIQNQTCEGDHCRCVQ